jgi:glycosyltransferase involved in cell wall biosynthesis
MGHLRPVKDPFRTESAVRHLPETSQIVVTHIGSALTDGMKQRAEAMTSRNARYEWRGELPRWKALRVLSRSRLLVLTSKMEGGANVVSEALACGVPVISSLISGSIGMLGKDYPGYFPVGDTRALTELLMRAEDDRSFYDALLTACRKQAWIVDPELEKQSWRDLLGELA